MYTFVSGFFFCSSYFLEIYSFIMCRIISFILIAEYNFIVSIGHNLSAHSTVDGLGLFLVLGSYKQYCYEHSSTYLLISTCLHFYRVNTKKLNYWDLKYAHI